jgi:NAD(P)-dependent dehydrogenase (short-subunit alcohol dehydrogenase family)
VRRTLGIAALLGLLYLMWKRSQDEMNAVPLANKAVIVTGAAAGIGRAIAHAFAREQIEDRHAETGTGIDAQEARVGQVVVAQGLQDDTGTCQAGAGHRQHQSPGQADLVKDVVFFKNPVT